MMGQRLSNKTKESARRSVGRPRKVANSARKDELTLDDVCEDKCVYVSGAGEASTNGLYSLRDPAKVPAGFARTCDEMGWPSAATWKKLSDGRRPWYEASNESYIYWNRSDRKWWIDVPSGAGAYITSPTSSEEPPTSGWQTLRGKKPPAPTVEVRTAAQKVEEKCDDQPRGKGRKEYYRKDGVRITHNPYAPGMAEKYGLPGQTDNEGFDPYADTVGAGIYGGSVKRDADGKVIIGRQYQNHNPRPGPVYDGKGYSLMSRAIQAGPTTVKKILEDFPELAEEISTGGARPLHTCGMSRKGQLSTQVLIDAGADIHALDTYGFTPLHRMASNNLEIGGEALMKAGADPNTIVKGASTTPIVVAKQSRARDFLNKVKELRRQSK